MSTRTQSASYFEKIFETPIVCYTIAEQGQKSEPTFIINYLWYSSWQFQEDFYNSAFVSSNNNKILPEASLDSMRR